MEKMLTKLLGMGKGRQAESPRPLNVDLEDAKRHFDNGKYLQAAASYLNFIAQVEELNLGSFRDPSLYAGLEAALTAAINEAQKRESHGEKKFLEAVKKYIDNYRVNWPVN